MTVPHISPHGDGRDDRNAACRCGHSWAEHQTPGAECVHSSEPGVACGCGTFREAQAASESAGHPSRVRGQRERPSRSPATAQAGNGGGNAAKPRYVEGSTVLHKCDPDPDLHHPGCDCGYDPTCSGREARRLVKVPLWLGRILWPRRYAATLRARRILKAHGAWRAR